ncbi:Circadian clock protein kinase KaiC [uncultured archaeon]|nr:Circadian clock protein kinase KaiC [uncultured archaeon]
MVVGKPSAKLKPTVAPVKRGEEAAPAPQQAARRADEIEGLVPSGIPGLDDLIGGGFEESSTTLVMGEAGCGKTTFLSQFLHSGAVDYGEPGVLLSFEEPSASILKHMGNYGFDFKALEDQNLFASINYRPHEVKKLVDEGGGLIWDTISSLGAKRLAIDSLTSYAMLFESLYQAREAELMLFDLLHKWECTTLLSGEGLHTEQMRITTGMEYLTDGVIVLHHPRYQAARYRAIEILKMRGARHSEKMCPFEFADGEGIKVYPGETIFYEVKDKEE